MPDYRLITNGFFGKCVSSIFQSPDFFRLHDGGLGAFFEWATDEETVAWAHFTPTADGDWRSPARGTFGGFGHKKDLRLEDLIAFQEAIELELKAMGAKRVDILLPPEAHDPTAFANCYYMLHCAGYSVTRSDLNHSLLVDERPLFDRMAYGNQKRLKKCRREALVAQEIGPSELPAVYSVLEENRSVKGNRLSMTLDQIETMRQVFPEAIKLFGCSDGNELVASAICIRVSADILYVFYWGDRPGYSAQSPVVAIADSIYAYCQDQHIALLDVGTSTLDQSPNHGLIQFKRGLGFSESLKVQMGKVL